MICRGRRQGTISPYSSWQPCCASAAGSGQEVIGVTWDPERKIVRVRKTHLCEGFSWALEDVVPLPMHMRSSACALGGDGENVGPSSPPSSWTRLWLCKELKSAKFLAGKVQNLGDFQRPGAWGLGAGCPPYRPQLGPCPCSPLLSAGSVGPTADSEQGREEGTFFTVGLGMGSPGCDFYGILPRTGHGTLGQSYV